MPKQILLADDSVTIHRAVQITFARQDYTVTAVKTGDEALLRAKELRPDVVLLDANMPDKTGYDVCAALRADAQLSTIPCLILTGNFAPYDEGRGAKAGVDGVVVKPFETQVLLDKVAEVTAKRSLGNRPSVSESGPSPSPSPSIAHRPTIAMNVAAAGESSRLPRPTLPRGAQSPSTTPLPAPPVTAAPLPPAPAQTPRPAEPAIAVPGTAPPVTRTSSPSHGTATPAPVTRPPLAPPSLPAPSLPPQLSVDPPSAKPRESGRAVAMPTQVPQMPRPSLIPNAPTPAPHKAADKVVPRATLLGVPNGPGSTSTLPTPPPAERTAPSSPAPAATVTKVAPPPIQTPGEAPASDGAKSNGEEPNSAKDVRQLSREVIERIAWEVVPELAETLIREQLDRLVREKQRS